MKATAPCLTSLCFLVLRLAHGAEKSGTIEKDKFRISYDERGITGLATPAVVACRKLLFRFAKRKSHSAESNRQLGLSYARGIKSDSARE